jgi:hypothetical protein
MYGNSSVILFLHFLIHAACWWLLCAAETCGCYWICYDKIRVSTEYVHIIACFTITRGNITPQKGSYVSMENLLLHQILGDCIKLCSCASHLCISNGHHVGITNEMNRYRFGIVMYLRHWKMSKISFETRAMLFYKKVPATWPVDPKHLRSTQKHTDAITLTFS